MNHPFEVTRKQGCEYIGHIYTVHVHEGVCDDHGCWDRPPHYEPDTVACVLDEDGNDVTAWAVKEFGEDVLVNGKGFDLT
jgi:hypothetical protein